MMAKHCQQRWVPDWAIRAKLQKLLDAGVDIDEMPGEWSVEDLMQLNCPDLDSETGDKD